MSAPVPFPVGACVRLVGRIGRILAGTEGVVVEYEPSLMNGFDVTVDIGDGYLLCFYADEIEAIR